jgi:3-deoxy-manno-octulosonate cytidylyltransferase (CMP-KDO synthetase)
MLVTTSSGRCIYMSRSPVPYHQKTLFFHYNKYVGIVCFNKQALDFFVKTNMGDIEKIEDIDHLRFL